MKQSWRKIHILQNYILNINIKVEGDTLKPMKFYNWSTNKNQSEKDRLNFYFKEIL